MKCVIDYIRNKNRQFAEASLFHYLSDSAVLPEQKLSIAPYMAHFVFSFMDINRFVLRDNQSGSALQKLVNIHTHEDADHWPWFLHDLKELGLDKTLPLTGALHFVWGDHCIASRLLTYRMIGLISQASDKEKIMIVEAIEMTGNVFLRHTAAVCAQMNGGDVYHYYGHHHYERETGHHMGCRNIEEQLSGINLGEDERNRGILLIDRVYALYHEFVDEMHRYATNHCIEDIRSMPHYLSTIDVDHQ